MKIYYSVLSCSVLFRIQYFHYSIPYSYYLDIGIYYLIICIYWIVAFYPNGFPRLSYRIGLDRASCK